MAHVVFLRAANVGGHNVFRPAELARALRRFNVVNVGAAGTFVVRSKATRADICDAITKRLPFEPEITVRPGREITTLVDANHFAGAEFSKVQRGFVAALARKPRRAPKLPVEIGKASGWVMRIERVEGHFALGLWHWRPGGFLIPSNVIETTLGVRSTVRWWETFIRIAKVLRSTGS